MNVNIGKKLPKFEVVDDEGNCVNNETILGNKVIFTVYAKDDTPSCNKQVCSLNEYYAKLKSKGYLVYGLSPDTVKKHGKFKEKYNIGYPLLADKDKTMLLDFGLFGPKMFMGKQVNGVYRSAIVVDEMGIVTHLIDKVITKSHGEQIMEVLGLV
ncbi:MAG: peroxiredoxin [Saprospiraceae bacterium]